MVADVADSQRRNRIEQFCSGETLTEYIEDIFDFQNASTLGKGNLGEVVRATDKITHENFALKIVSLGRLKEIGLGESKIRREAAVLNELVHPNIVRLVDVLVGYSDLPWLKYKPPYFCIVTECLENAQPLSDVIRFGGSQIELARTIVPQLVSALALIHSKGIVHRDLWSENVLLCKHECRAVLVDFGSAEYADMEALGHFLNLPYMSPQAALGEHQHPADDAWSFGILVTELITGRFVTVRMNSSDKPFGNELILLATAIHETAEMAGQEFGLIAANLLNREMGARYSMQDVSRELQKLRPRPVGRPVASGAWQTGKEIGYGAGTIYMPEAPVKVPLSSVKQKLIVLHDELAEIKTLFGGCSSEEAKSIMRRFNK